MRISDWSSDVCSSDLARAELDDRLRVDLADPALGHPEDRTDLGEGEALVVVEGEHDLLALGQPADGVGEDLAHLLHLVGGHRTLALVGDGVARSEEHTSELQSLLRISYAVF